MTLRPQACPFKIRIPICLPRELKQNFRGSPTDGSSLLRLDVFQEADSYECFACRNLAAHKFECVFDSGTVYPRSFHSGNSTLRILMLRFQNKSASFEHKRRLLYGVQLHNYLYQTLVLRPNYVPEKFM